MLSQPKSVTVLLALLVAAMLSLVVYVAGHEVSISAFYLIPICWACWAVGRRTGFFVATAATVMWFIADLLTADQYGGSAISFWNALMLLALFVVVVYLLSASQAAQRHLEETVRLRTAALQAEIVERKRLEIAKVQSERLAAVGTMAAEVAHEIRNPLGSIALNLDLIQKEVGKIADTPGYSPEEGRLLVSEMRAEVHRIQNVLGEYLQSARLPKPQRQPLALNEFLDQKLAFVNAEFEQAKVKLHSHFDPTLRTISADAEQLWQATLNLIRNGLDAMPDGGELTVSTRRDGGQVQLRVTDSGKGMTDEQLKQVFMPFFTTKTAGTGLGLTLVQQIATEHGGHVECESAVGKGSTFTIFLPIVEES